MTTFAELFKSGADIDAIIAHLDALSEEERFKQIVDFPGGSMAELYDRAESKKTKVATMIPKVDEIVIYSGKNSLPMFSRFSKPMLRRPGASEGFGHNRGFTTFASGPGYFMVIDDPESGEASFDYKRVPEEKPEDWPPIQPNTGFKIGTLVYGNMLDCNRWVSSHTIVGRAFRNGKVEAHYVVTQVTVDPHA